MWMRTMDSNHFLCAIPATKSAPILDCKNSKNAKLSKLIQKQAVLFIIFTKNRVIG